MIDTDKYEGHLMNEDFQVWAWSRKMLKVATYEEQMATAGLLRDTPLLLAEVKRLYEMNEKMRNEIHVALDNERMRNGANEGWLKALEYVLALMDVQEEEE